jgi:hypothetical protein
LTVPGAVLPGPAGAYDVAPDGRFLITVGAEGTDQPVRPITLVLNWQAGLKR